MEGPDGAPVLILANPIGTTRAIWDAQARILREDHRLLRFELRGHGAPGAQSDAPPGPYSVAELGTDVLSLMREHGVATAALVHPGFHRPAARGGRLRRRHAARHRPGGLRGLR